MKRIIVKRVGVLIFLVVVAGVWAASAVSQAEESEKHPPVEFSVSCVECHEKSTPEVVNAWDSGKHGLTDIGCFICHGDGEVEFYSEPTDEKCVACHSKQESSFDEVEATSCFSCHSGHNLKFHQ